MDLNDYRPRDVFLPLHKRSKRWAVVIAHRRAGKTVAMCADLVIGAIENALDKPQFAYLAPFRDQAKKVAWGYLKDLTKPLWAKPPNESELKLVIKNGHGGESTIYVAGADNPDALRGMYFDGVVLDEVGQIRPSAWYSVLRPSLSDRRGWAIFAGTPAGKNFFWQMREEARLNPETHILLELPASKTGILHPDELRDAKAQMTEEAYATEYEISFDAAIPGAYYAKLIGEAYDQGRVKNLTIDTDFTVDLVADLGFTDSCSWWGWHAKAKSLQTGKSIIEQFLISGITPRLVPELSLQDGIEAARLTLPKCYFDEKATYDGVEHLRGYMREWDEKTQTYRNRPKHDQHSHAADAFRYLSIAAKPVSSNLSRGDVNIAPRRDSTYRFSLDDVWDCQPSKSGRLG
jgi:phage terminase large subunit